MKHTISILCDDVPGVMTRISGLFSRRGFNIESLSVGTTDKPGKSRFTIVVNGDDTVLEQVRKQLQKLINVINVWDYSEEAIVSREHALLKLKASRSNRSELLQLVSSIQARIIDSSGDIWTLEITGDTDDVSSFIDLFKHYEIVETIRTGKIALKRG
ncbi:acetolactate synthase small subunit [Oceanispirochaeta sp. M1]|uniref:acetolactate synthase small subunit n=1 Tax=Oceanispirochaeta sp. M1 TaxID=2283433 RepID=UPI000E098465|nr:acetolactate synthase small subunit [Oceanispirochaeta sp. M1]NPD72702.1 acetolactate synthase small subunit [Oceanispirochaeta sp. M1]RDG31850.1 acetolactate synthase small subunit [Oceanispirochaeta sp. M1]